MKPVSYEIWNLTKHLKDGAPGFCIVRIKGKAWRVVFSFHTQEDAEVALRALVKGEG